MAKALKNIHTLTQTTSSGPTLRALWILRLVVGLGIVLGGAIALVGTSWDIQWHTFVGRDRTLIPPHIMMLTGVALAGLLALISVVLETSWVRRNAQLARYSTDFSGLFYSSTGSYLAGFAALAAAIAFPLDSYWHALYGIDVSIWAPFHIMILTGMAVMPLGAAYLLVSSARLAAIDNMQWGVRAARIGTIFALGTTMGIFTLMLSDALEGGNSIQIWGGFINFYPLLASMVAAFTFVIAKYALPYRASATYVMLTYILFALLFSVFVPPATSTLVTSEGLTYRRALYEFAYLSIVAVRFWPLLPVIIAPLIDVVFAWAKRHNWSTNSLVISLAVLAALSFWPVFVLEPALGLEYVAGLGALGSVLSLLLGLAGSYVATLLGRYGGTAMSQEGSVALLALFADIAASLASTAHGSTPAKVVHVQAGPYPLTVSLYKDPADAGYALPFAITSTRPLTYNVKTLPDQGVSATAVRATISPDANNKNEVQGTAEITVRGGWHLHIVANGPQGSGVADVPITATAPSVIPSWLGWLIGAIPLIGLFAFLFMQRVRRKSDTLLTDNHQQSDRVPATM
jgi:hypothetical protein